jgi:hypothetical protein
VNDYAEPDLARWSRGSSVDERSAKRSFKKHFSCEQRRTSLVAGTKKVDGTKLEVQEALHELLGAGYVGILSMGGGPNTTRSPQELTF